MVKRRLRVLYFTPLRGGIGNWSRCLIEYLDKLADVEIVTFRKKRQMDDKSPFTRVKEKDILEIIKPNRPHHILEYDNKKSLKKLIELTNKYKPDIVHLVLWGGKQILWFVNDYSDFLKKQKIPIIMTLHDVYPTESKSIKEQKMYVDAWKKADMLVVLTKKQLGELKKFYTKIPIDIIPHGIYHFQNKNRVNKEQARKIVSKKMELKIKEGYNVILFFGYIREYKGLMYLIKAAPKILKLFPNTLFLAVGTIDMSEGYNRYQREIDKLKLNKNFIIYPQYVNDQLLVESFYKSCDVIVFPYTRLTISGALFSGIGMKRPAIISELGEFIKSLDKKGLIYTTKPGDVKSLEKAVIKVLSNKKEANKKALKAYKVTKELYNWKKIVKGYFDNYLLLIQKNKSN
ncbi:glycosyltransferase [Chloroflexota bacterium]